MNGPSKRQADPDAPARPCLFYAACSKYSIKAQVRRVTRKAAIPRATTKAVSLRGMIHELPLLLQVCAAETYPPAQQEPEHCRGRHDRHRMKIRQPYSRCRNRPVRYAAASTTGRDAREEPEERTQGDKDVFACPAPRSKGKLRPSLLQWRQTDRYCATACRHCGQAANAARDCRCADRNFAAKCKAQRVSAVLKSVILVVV